MCVVSIVNFFFKKGKGNYKMKLVGQITYILKQLLKTPLEKTYSSVCQIEWNPGSRREDRLLILC